MKKFSLLVFTIFTLVTSLVGCSQTEKNEEETERKYVLGEVVDGMTVVADGSDGYVVLEGVDDKGEIGFILEYDDNELQATSTISSKGRFIALLDNYYVGMMESSEEQFDEVRIYTYRTDNEVGARYYSVLKIPCDTYSVYPNVEDVRVSGNEVWFTLRYHTSENELSDEVVMYRGNAEDKYSFAEVENH